MAGKDYYKTLGVDKGASAADIKKKFRKLALKYHPDQNQGDKAAEQKFKEINEAYAVLSDAEKRKQYDMFGADGFNQRFSTEDIFQDLIPVLSFDGFGGGGGGFENFFGGGFMATMRKTPCLVMVDLLSRKTHRERTLHHP